MNDDFNVPQTLEIREDFKIYDYVSFNKHGRNVKTMTTFQNDETSEVDDGEDSSPDVEVTDGSEQDAQASQVPPEDKRKLPLYCNRNFYNLPVNTNHSAVHVPSNVYERCKLTLLGFEVRSLCFKPTYSKGSHQRHQMVRRTRQDVS